MRTHSLSGWQDSAEKVSLELMRLTERDDSVERAVEDYSGAFLVCVSGLPAGHAGFRAVVSFLLRKTCPDIVPIAQQ